MSSEPRRATSVFSPALQLLFPTWRRRVVLSRLAQLDRSEFWFYSALPSLASQLAAPGERPEIVTKVDPKNATEGVQGLKALGVRELTYRLSFLASSVQASVI